MIDRRHEPRPRLLVDVRVHCRDSGDFLGVLVDLTHSGLMLIGGARIVPGRWFQLNLELPAEIEGTTAIPVAARSLWTCRQPASDRRLTGFGELEAGAVAGRRIERLLAEYATGEIPFSGADVIDLSR